MKTLPYALLLAAFALGLMSCSDNSSSVVTPNEKGNAAGVSLAKGGPVVHSATGSMHLYPEGESKPRTCAFTARQYEGGQYEGEYQIYRHGTSAYDKWHGKVLYVNVEGNKALIVGAEDHQTGAWDGWYDAFVAIDNGEGAKDRADVMSFVWNTNDPAVLANWMTMSADGFVQYLQNAGIPIEEILYPVQIGNIQVR